MHTLTLFSAAGVIHRRPRRRLRPLSASSSPEDPADEDGTDGVVQGPAASSLVLFGAIPLLSLGLPLLLQAKLFAALFVAKRLYIYSMAGAVVTIASLRGVGDDPSLGARLVALTREVLPLPGSFTGAAPEARPSPPSPSANAPATAAAPDPPPDTRFAELQALDQVDASTQSVALPFLVGGSLVFSVLLLRLQGTAGGGLDELMGADSDLAAALQPALEALRAALPDLARAANALTVALFTRAELDRALRPLFSTADAPTPADDADGALGAVRRALDPAASALPSLVGALLLSALAYLGPPALVWPVQNLVGMCIAIAVARAVQLPRLGPIAVALGGLVVYDVVSVGVSLINLGSATLAAKAGAAAAGAAATAGTTAGAAASASSAMGAVAMSKVAAASGSAGAAAQIAGGGGGWQPGLFEVLIRGRVSDLLGLGDAVFPSLLSTFALRYDRHRAATGQPGPQPDYYFTASLVGFAGGCVACEFAPGIDSAGLPALLFIVPAMLTAVLGLAAARRDLADMWDFDPNREPVSKAPGDSSD